ncbi:MAG: hypothetical protein HC903_27830 [Methylacidiphilales bacterium]|nr:hypothetical protein [Candidatus Methylacidiphilales bacterium]NJR19596.1 hypothetical protein [Calothrix sp. CSU_2_0]
MKSLDRIDIINADVLSSCTLTCDRELTIFDSRGKFVNGKNNPKVYLAACHIKATQQNYLNLVGKLNACA